MNAPCRRGIEYVVLAAGSSKRMGFAKAVTPLAGASPLQRLAALTRVRRVTVVTNRSLATQCRLAMPGGEVVVTDDAELGMIASMRTAHASIHSEATLGILLADKPFLTAATLDRCERALLDGPCDVLVARFQGEAGHPVYFGPAARALLAGAPNGDTLRTIRDDATLIRRTIDCDDSGIVEDLDTPEAWSAAERRLHEMRRA